MRWRARSHRRWHANNCVDQLGQYGRNTGRSDLKTPFPSLLLFLICQQRLIDVYCKVGFEKCCVLFPFVFSFILFFSFQSVRRVQPSVVSRLSWFIMCCVFLLLLFLLILRICPLITICFRHLTHPSVPYVSTVQCSLRCFFVFEVHAYMMRQAAMAWARRLTKMLSTVRAVAFATSLELSEHCDTRCQGGGEPPLPR